MPAACSVCGQAFEPEVGFYWGAMYVSYGFSTFIVAIVVVLLYRPRRVGVRGGSGSHRAGFYAANVSVRAGHDALRFWWYAL